MITLDQLQALMPLAGTRCETFIIPLNAAMKRFFVDTTLREAAFLAQIAHESGELRYVRELGNAAYLDKYDTGKLAARLGNTPEDDDDGQLYRGRGLIQITGHTNYLKCAAGLNLPLLEHPELLEIPEHACASAGWFWQSHGLNGLADTQDFLTITKVINGGTNGYGQRLAYYEHAKKLLLTGD